MCLLSWVPPRLNLRNTETVYTVVPVLVHLAGQLLHGYEALCLLILYRLNSSRHWERPSRCEVEGKEGVYI